jgi:RHS repeat-associated protein
MYSYNKNGDMSSRTINSGTQTNFLYTGNMMASASDGETFSLDYDENGNLIYSSHESPATSYEYNWDNKLRSAEIGSTSIGLKYDPLGNRIYKNSSEAGARKYIVDVSGRLPTILCEIDPCDASDPNGSLKYSYIYTPGGQILAQQAYNAGAEPNEPNDLYFYIHDRLGSVRLVINDAADVNNSYTYSPSGEMFASECTETVYNPFLFTGQWWDPEIRQYYLRARMYSPYLGIFTSRDPVMGRFQEPMTLHAYLYCMNDPLNRIDPDGESALQIANGLRIGTILYSTGVLVACAGVHYKNLDLIQLGGAIMELSYPVGLAIGMAMGGPGSVSQVTRWGDEIKAGRYVVKGGKNPFNYLRTFKWLPNQYASAVSIK